MGNRLLTAVTADPKVNFMIWVAHNYWNGVLHRIDRAGSPRHRQQEVPSESPDLRRVSRGPPDGNSSQSDCEDCDGCNVTNSRIGFQEDSDCCSCSEGGSDSDFSTCSCSLDGCSARKVMKSDISRFDDSGGIRGRSISPLNRSRHERRPPVYSVEDYATFLHRLSKLSPSQLYLATLDKNKKNNENKEQWKNNENMEMVSRQPASVSELLHKLKLDLKAAYSSFAKEFVSYPFDGVTVLLDILRLIQLSQAEISGVSKAAIRRENHTRMRRAVADEQSCLTCLQHCLTLDPEEAPRRLVEHDNGLYTVAVCLLSHVNKSRIAALELLSRASGVQPNGHDRVSDALSALRLRFGEPVRLKFLVGMMKSGKGELLLAGMKFFNSLILTAPSIRDKVYLQKEIEDAGFNPDMLDKCDDDETEILLRKELALWRDAVVDVDAMADRLCLISGTNSALKKDLEDLRNRLAKLEDEKNIFSTAEASLRQRIHELESENSRLRAQIESPMQPTYDTPNGSTIIRLTTDNDTLNHEITSSTSLSSLSDGFEKFSPLPQDGPVNIAESIRGDDVIYVETQYGSDVRYREHVYEATNSSLIIPTNVRAHVDEDTTIDDVLQELSNIVHDEERSDNETNVQLTKHDRFEDRASPDRVSDELKIVPTRHPQPPKRNSDFLTLDVNIDYDESEVDCYSGDIETPRFKSLFGRKISQNYGISPFRRYDYRSDSDNGRASGDGATYERYDEGDDYETYGAYRKRNDLQRNDSFRYKNFVEYKGRNSAEREVERKERNSVERDVENIPVKSYRRRTQIINYDFNASKNKRSEESRRRTRSFESLLVQAMPFYNDVPSYENTAAKSGFQIRSPKRFENSKYECAKNRTGFLKNKLDDKPRDVDTEFSRSQFSPDKFLRPKNPRLCDTTSGLY